MSGSTCSFTPGMAGTYHYDVIILNHGIYTLAGQMARASFS